MTAAPRSSPRFKNKLGLRLDKTVDVPVDVFVIDNLDKLPMPD